MVFFPIFLSVIVVVKNQSEQLKEILSHITESICSLVSDYEIIIIDNASEDNSAAILKSLTNEVGLPNLQIYVLTKEVDTDIATSIGLENALGDFLTVIDPLTDDIVFLPIMLEKSVQGADVVFATNLQKPTQNLIYQMAYKTFIRGYKFLCGINLTQEAPSYRILSRRIINFILEHPKPAMAFRYLPATSGFAKVNLKYSATPKKPQKKCLRENIDRGIHLLVSTTAAPMRVVTLFCLFGAMANIIYSIYVVTIGVFKMEVAPGWISLSLQQSGMFFLISLVLLFLAEYILYMGTLSNEGPQYHIAQEFTSAQIKSRERLNIQESSTLKINPIFSMPEGVI